ncbi:mRNA-decapping enzyme 1A isoform X3 [Hydra vulgaris]|uniref:mRNA-decapping enzyme 1A isoform X3 n=1 Tax=Hydra vulgaris TaxID=6087 RepID=A0ABM4C5V2_HYDVU
MAETSKAEMEINFSALKKHDQDIIRIIDTASSVAQYNFKASLNVWDKTEVEGALFLYSRRVPPYVVIFIMNRLNTQNAQVVLTKDMDFMIQKPFLLCKSANNEISGIWFYDEDECERFGILLSKYVQLFKDEKLLKQEILCDENKLQPPKNDLFYLFSKAQEEFKARPKLIPLQVEKQKINKRPQAVDQTSNHCSKPPIILKRNSLSNSKPHDEEKLLSPDVIKEKTELQSDNQDHRIYCHDDVHHDDTERSGIYSRIMSSNGVPYQKTDQAFQDGNNAVTDLPGLVRNSSEVKPKVIGCAELESELLNKVILNQVANTSNQNSNYLSNTVLKSDVDYSISTVSATTSTNKTSESSENSAPHVQLLSPSILASKSVKRGNAPSGLVNGHNKVLLAATFATQGTKVSKKLFGDEQKIEQGREAPSASCLNSLMSPAAFQLRNKTKEKELVLSKDEFQQTLLNVIQNDDRFVTMLHEAYLEVLRKDR